MVYHDSMDYNERRCTMSEKSEEARKRYQAPQFVAGSARASEAGKKGAAASARKRAERALIRKTLEAVLASDFPMKEEKKRLRLLGFNPKTVQQALVMSVIAKAIQDGNNKALIQYAQLLGELEFTDNGSSKVDAILAEIDRKAEDDRCEVEDDGDA